MKIAILGAGNVGATLGKRFAEVGHDVVFGVRDPEKYADAQLAGAVSTNNEAVRGASVVVLAVPYGAAEAALKECGNLSGKIVVDATNPLAMTASGLGLTVGFETSGAEIIAGFLNGGKLVKCFNTTGFATMADPRGSMMFVCGDDSEANETVRRLSDEIGFETLNIGDLTRARLLEPLAMLWIHLAFTSELKRDFAFTISKR